MGWMMGVACEQKKAQALVVLGLILGGEGVLGIELSGCITKNHTSIIPIGEHGGRLPHDEAARIIQLHHR
jgi:hypothetical protein